MEKVNEKTPKKEKVKKILVRPFTYLTDSIGEESLKMLFLLFLQVAMLFFTRTYASLFVILSAAMGSVCASLISIYVYDAFQLEDNFQIPISIIQGIVTGMFIPGDYPPFTVFFVTLLVMLFAKHLFGGFACAWVNPSICAVLVLWIIGSRIFPDFLVTQDLISSRNPSQFMIENGVFPIYKLDPMITEALNNTVFAIFKVSIPEGYVSLLWDTGSSIPAFRFNFLSMLSSIVIFSDELSKGLSSFAFLVVYTLLVRFVFPLMFGFPEVRGDVLLSLLTGGTLFCCTFVIGWYGTNPMTIGGKILYGSLAGLFALLVAGCGTSPSGMVFTVMIVNIISVFIQQFEMRYDRKRMERLMEKRMASEK
ncbi:MAG: RnfABCDGE type electron transport complex subunit D [Treponema sp.]